MSRELAKEIRAAQAARRYMRRHGINASWNNALVVDRARQRGHEVRADDCGRVSITDGNRSRWFSSGRVSINRLLAKRAVRYKDVASALLRAYDVRAPENAIFEIGEVDRAWAWAQDLSSAVLKPNDTEQGVMVYVGVTSREEFVDAFEAIENKHGKVLVEEFMPGVEHRVLVIDNEVVAATRRVPANVVGDGRSDIPTLVQAKNKARERTKNPIHESLKLDAAAERELTKQDLSPTAVPEAGQVVYLRSTSNIHTGGDAVDATDELRPEEVEFVQRAARVFTGLRVAGFDVLLPRDGQGEEPCVLEINASPMISMHHFPSEGRPRDAAGKLVDAMFPSRAR
ncbi:MAG TPA: hypothetical protein VK063_13095 [Beutenbergiaceae bacterium]|nr:hypothetical protein [Beutenbergiaceae bacterium]